MLAFLYKFRKSFWLAIILAGMAASLPGTAEAQQTNRRQRIIIVDSTLHGKDSSDYVDSIRRKDIRKATIRSAIIPGWGQITNRQAWKVPIVYGGLSIPAYMFYSNVNRYRDLRDAYRLLMTPGYVVNELDFPEYLRPLLGYPNSIRTYRDSYRRDVDYSVLYFIGAWGLNVVDATVFAHLRDFDVSDDISMRFKPVMDPQAKSVGVGLVFEFGKQKPLSPIPQR